MKVKLQKNIFILLALFVSMIMQTVPTYASVQPELLRRASDSCKQGKYLYYCTQKGIERFNTKTGKHNLAVSNKYKGENTNGFSDLNIKGNYIYCTYDLQLGSSDNRIYIYKISKSGKKIKLDSGYFPIVVGNWIYYIKSKFITENNFTYQKDIGIYKMKLDGSSKKKISNDPYLYGITKSNIVVGNNDEIFEISLKNNKIRKKISDKKRYITKNKYNWGNDFDKNKTIVKVNGYTYTVIEGDQKIIQSSPSKKKRIIYKVSKNASIRGYDIFGNWLIVRVTTSGRKYNNFVYVMNLKSSKKVQLAKWWDV